MDLHLERARDVANYWSWLPAFRAVAETEHLPTAAKLLCVSPSAVSRTLRLLEEHFGEALFDRSAGRLVLNARGSILLECVRHAMRTVHEGTEAMRGAQLAGTLRLSASGVLARTFVVPSLPRLRHQLPSLVLELVSVPPADLDDALRQGALDLALVENTQFASAMDSQIVARLDHDVFVRPDSELTRRDLESLCFAVPADGIADAWPSAWPRQIGLRTSCARTAIDAVFQGLNAVVLPRAVGEQSGLRGLHVRGLETTDLVLVHRDGLGVLPTAAESVAELLVLAIAERVHALPGVSLVEAQLSPSTEIAL